MRETAATSNGLWPHQHDAVAAIEKALQDQTRAQVVMACGTGKTIVGAEATRRLAPRGRIVVVVPTIALVDQTATAYARHLGAACGPIVAVCSDNCATMDAEQVTADLAELGALTTTDPHELAARLKAHTGRITVITTYASLPVIATAHERGAPAWDLVVVDEAHRSAGRADRVWSQVHHDSSIPSARRLYMTATPRLAESERYETVSMDDTAVFGPLAYQMPFGNAIELGLLADYRLVVAVVADRDVAAMTAQGEPVQVGGFSLPADMAAGQVALLRAAHDYGLRRVITYHQRVLRAQRFAESLHAARNLLQGQVSTQVIARVISGEDPIPRRRETLRLLEHPGDRLVVVSNARVLAEGVDVPELDAVMFADPRDSATDVVQAVGRALRRGKTSGKIATIIVPIFLNAAETPEAALEGSQFDVVFRVVRALRVHDERLADWLDEERVRLTREDEHGQAGAHELPQWWQVLGPAWSAEFSRAVLVKTVASATSSWWEGYARARDFHTANGHLQVPRDHVTASGFGLGAWIATQRRYRRRNTLPSRRIAALDELGMVWNPGDAAWEHGLAHTAAYAREHGHLQVPTAYACKDGYRLGAWLAAARARYREGRLPAGGVCALEALGMVWHVFEDRWERYLDALDAYAHRHGHLDIPRDHVTEHGLTLGRWLSDQRGRYRTGELGPGQLAELETRGVVLDPIAATWREKYHQVAAYLAEHQAATLPNGHPLKQWLSSQRSLARRGRLTPERVQMLRQIGVEFDPYAAGFAAGLAALAAFAGREGHTTVPAGHIENGVKLGFWLHSRRAEYRAGILAPDRAAAMEGLGVVWDPHAQDWRDGLADCVDFYHQHGHLDIRGKVTGTRIKALGAWLQRRRAEYHDGTLAPDRIQALQQCGMQWEDSRVQQRDRAHAALRDFHDRYGHITVPAGYVSGDGFKLGQWLRNKMRSYRGGSSAHPQTHALLLALGADWVADRLQDRPERTP